MRLPVFAAAIPRAPTARTLAAAAPRPDPRTFLRPKSPVRGAILGLERKLAGGEADEEGLMSWRLVAIFRRSVRWRERGRDGRDSGKEEMELSLIS